MTAPKLSLDLIELDATAAVFPENLKNCRLRLRICVGVNQAETARLYSADLKKTLNSRLVGSVGGVADMEDLFLFAYLCAELHFTW